jgi:hypothetical protein
MTYALERLRRVFAPEVVAVPPTNPIRDLMLLPDGEIRHYGFTGDFRANDIRMVYLSSRDHGLSWSELPAPAGSPGATVQSPWSGDFLTVLASHGTRNLEEYQDAHASCPTPGIYAFRSTTGADGPFAVSRVGDLLPRLLVPRQPLALRNRKRWLLPAQAQGPDKQMHPVVFRSDDDGRNWDVVMLPMVPRPGLRWPHAGLRWENCGDEPCIAELSDGRLHMLIRTAQDEFWQSFSEDGGERWSLPEPSRFFGTITTPLLHRLRDGRLLAVWNNTTPLPEVDHATQPGLSDDERAGVWEDVFTNRDALHAAISADDGATWRGFRELHLNERRNDGDFRSSGGSDVTVDKSIHQSQLVELPEGKVLLAFGQHPLCRRIIRFDPDWLLETSRSDDFRHGLGGWSVQQYLRSVPGNFRGFSGHCSLNRRAGASLVPHPDGEMREVLQVASFPDARLLDERQGAVWNFPAASSGRLRLRLRLPAGSTGCRIALVDRWFNPTDPVVATFSAFVVDIDGMGRIDGQEALSSDCWHLLHIRWDPTDASVQIDDGPAMPRPGRRPSRDGISYLHMQSTASQEDPHGILIASVEQSRS